MYKGKEVCQGCKKPGNVVPRYQKTDLCPSCTKVMIQGRAELTYLEREYVEVFQHYTAYRDSLTFNDSGEDKQRLNGLMLDVLEALHIPGAETVESQVYLKGNYGSNGKRYRIPKEAVEPLRNFGNWLENKISEIRDTIKNMPLEARKEVSKVKNEIYNEGVEEGRNLLWSLNSGEITMEDFGKNLTYKGDK